MKNFLKATLAIGLCAVAIADPLNQSLPVGTSLSGNYGARNIHLNPAALAFETELNGFSPLSYFSYGNNRSVPDEFSLGLTFGLFGLGFESLSQPEGKFQRYHVALAAPLTPTLFMGGRFGFQRADASAIAPYDSLDLGFQFRPTRYFSLGWTILRLNQPKALGTSLGSQWVVGATLRPWHWFDITIDGDTSSKNFGSNWGYQVTANTRVMPGLTVQAGYHKDYQWQAGVQWDLGQFSAYSTVQPRSDSKRLVSGISVSALPQTSLIKPVTALKIHIDDTLSDEGKQGTLFAQGRPSLWSVIAAINTAADQKIAAIHLTITSFPLGLASAQELYDALLRAREKKVNILVFLGNASLKEFLIASAANQIHMERNGTLTTLGLKVDQYFLRGSLDKFGVEPEFLARGEYKSAPEAFLLKKSSERNRKLMLSELKEAEKYLLPLLQRHRSIDNNTWNQMLTSALHSADEAIAKGLIDQVGSYAEFCQKNEGKFLVRTSLKQQSQDLSLPPRIAVVHAAGDILQDRIGLLSVAGRKAVTPKGIETQLNEALKDSRTQAIVLRINSGGGEILASEQIATLLEKAKKEKPVYATMADAAASGGYFIAAPGKRIFAQSLTLTGSIGVFLGKFSFQGLYRWLDLNKEVLSHAPYPNLFSEHKPWTEAERAILKRRMDSYYDAFVAYVAEQRHLKSDAAERAAKGRVWLGGSAIEQGLVDDLGGFHAAIQTAARDTGIKDHFEVWELQEPPSLLSALGLGALGTQASHLAPLNVIAPRVANELFWLSLLQENPFLYRTSFDSVLP